MARLRDGWHAWRTRWRYLRRPPVLHLALAAVWGVVAAAGVLLLDLGTQVDRLPEVTGRGNLVVRSRALTGGGRAISADHVAKLLPALAVLCARDAHGAPRIAPEVVATLFVSLTPPAADPAVSRLAGSSRARPGIAVPESTAEPPVADSMRARIRGVTAGSFRVRREATLAAGRLPEPGRAECLVGAGAAQALGVDPAALSLGATLEFAGSRFTVAGLFSASGSALHSEIWVPAAALVPRAFAGHTQLVMVPRAGIDAARVAATVRTLFAAGGPNASRPARTTARDPSPPAFTVASEATAEAERRPLSRLVVGMLVTGGIVTLVLAFVGFGILARGLEYQTRGAYALWRVAGARPNAVRRRIALTLGLAIVMAMTSAALAVRLGADLRFVTELSIVSANPGWITTLGAALAALLMGALGSLAPLRRATHRSPAEGLTALL